VSKDKKKKKDKKPGKGGGSKATGTLKALAKNPMVADVVAAALVATASALKDSKRARALASDAADELGKLSKSGAKSGEALWDMALAIGRRSLETLSSGDKTPKPVAPKARPSPSARKTGNKKKATGSKTRKA
jgi:hypothetical protein